MTDVYTPCIGVGTKVNFRLFPNNVLSASMLSDPRRKRLCRPIVICEVIQWQGCMGQGFGGDANGAEGVDGVDGVHGVPNIIPKLLIHGQTCSLRAHP